jgi:hypothetical protein
MEESVCWPDLLEYMCPGGKTSKRSQSSFKAFISDAKYTPPADSRRRAWIHACNASSDQFQTMIPQWENNILWESCRYWRTYHRFPNPGTRAWCRWDHERQWRTCHASPPTQTRTFRPTYPRRPHPPLRTVVHHHACTEPTGHTKRILHRSVCHSSKAENRSMCQKKAKDSL